MMKYVVAIHAHSPVAYAYAGTALRVKVGVETHLGFDCSEIDTSNPTYLYVKTLPNEHGGVQRQLQFPHSAVLFIVHYDDTQRPAEFDSAY
jgi:hypothetical protein